nr:SAM-dependent methyltransferase [Mycobacterium lepraemurium]
MFELGVRAIAATRGDPNNVDIAGATAAGIPVLNTPGRNADAVAEMTVALLLAATRHLLPADTDVPERDQGRHRAGGDPGVRAGRARLPAGLAGRHGGLRGGPAAGHRLQNHGAGAAGRRAHGRAPGGAVDLRDDWPAALRAAGFDPNRPTAWSAERLLGYLPPEAQDRLLDTITDLSAPGSRLATESAPNPAPGEEEKLKERMQAISQRWRAHGFDLDMAGLVYFGERNEAAPYLADHGWRLNSVTIRDLFADNRLDPLDDDDTRMGEMLYTWGIYE